MKLSLRGSLALFLAVLMAGLVSAQDAVSSTGSANGTDSSSSGSSVATDTGASAQLKNLFTQAMSIQGAIAFLIILILVIGLIYLYRRNTARDALMERQNRRASAALDATTTPAAVGSNAVDLHAVVVGAASDAKDKEDGVVVNTASELLAATAQKSAVVPASPKVAGRRGSGSQVRPPAVSTSAKAPGSQPPSPGPQVVKVRRPSLKGNASPVVASVAKGHSRSRTPDRA